MLTPEQQANERRMPRQSHRDLRERAVLPWERRRALVGALFSSLYGLVLTLLQSLHMVR